MCRDLMCHLSTLLARRSPSKPPEEEQHLMVRTPINHAVPLNFGSDHIPGEGVPGKEGLGRAFWCMPEAGAWPNTGCAAGSLWFLNSEHISLQGKISALRLHLPKPMLRFAFQFPFAKWPNCAAPPPCQSEGGQKHDCWSVDLFALAHGHAVSRDKPPRLKQQLGGGHRKGRGKGG